MRVNRSYLPYRAARNYQDRQMAKWMGFFLSEHTTAMGKTDPSIDWDQVMEEEVKLVLLNQIYFHHLSANFCIRKQESYFYFSGQIDQWTHDRLALVNSKSYLWVNFADILNVYYLDSDDDGF
ncbi:hypothetical protein ACWOBE_03675 [Hutsoniella sourekii]